MDQMVLETQKWLNKNYAGKNGYNIISEDGVTGWGTMKALVTALQIELGISVPNGNFGPATTAAFKPLSIGSTKTNQNYILQGGLFCKGYNPGGFTGTFGNGTQEAIKKLQSDAGISSTGTVDALLMKSILTMDAFVLLNYGEYHGDENIRTIQKYLNNNYSSNQYFAADIGLVPCDGIYGRTTNKALLYAFQIEEGISVPNGVFGPSTSSLAPVLSVGSTKTKFIYLLQFALYCNTFDPNGFDGQFGNGVKVAVANFQKFSALSADGIVGVQTWASLLVSTGDKNRKGTMCDCATTITDAKAKTLKNNGYISVGRYLTGKYKMSNEEINTIISNGLRIFPIFETGGYQLSYFNGAQGNKDAKEAINIAHKFGFDAGTIIYFAVDFDALDSDVTKAILPYFSEIYGVFKRTKTTYKIGIYAPRNVCIRISEAGYSCSSFVCDMSTGFSGNLGYPLPKDWAIDQISTITIGSGAGQIEIDNNISSGRDIGVSSINLNNTANGYPDSYVPPDPGTTNPSIPTSNGFEYIVVSGKEKLIEDNGENRYKYNFIETAVRKLNDYYQDRRKIPAGSERHKDRYTWLVHRHEYSTTDLENFKKSAAEFDCELVVFDSNEQFVNYLNTRSINGTGSRNMLIKEFTLFGHGHVGDITISTTKDGKSVPFHTKDITKINRNSFYKPKTEFYSCNSLTGVYKKDDYSDSFAYKWVEHLGYSSLKGFYLKSDYREITAKTVYDKLVYKALRSERGYMKAGSFYYPCADLTDSNAKEIHIIPIVPK